MFNRNCPNCNCELIYTNKKNRNSAEKNKVMCKTCTSLYKKIETLKKTNKFEKRRFNNEQKEYIISQINNPNEIRKYVDEINKQKNENLRISKNITRWFRNCPKCGKEIKYKTKNGVKFAQKNNAVCYECVGKVRSENMKGEKNHFFGKHHLDKSKDKAKLSKDCSESYKKHLIKIKSEEHKKTLSSLISGEKNPRYKKGSLYDIWFEKYGEEEAKRKDFEYKSKLSLINKGKNNNMYGKPSPNGSGNGWSGWYKEWFFRSIHELSYVINIIEKNNSTWESAEKRKYMVEYVDDKGEKRNYFSDFIVDGKKMVEVKPEKLKKTKNVILKCKAAEKFCNENGYIFEIITPEILSENEIKTLYLNKNIKFTEKYEQKFKNKFNF